uniref:Uncharacterized protein n=1 Tax=Haplochromis burtoni TaxID=8153 RepID=A0A3Q2X490_HAPBU
MHLWLDHLKAVVVTSPSANVKHGLKMAPSHALRCCKRALNWVPVLFINLVVGWSYYAYVVELCVFSYLVIFHIFLAMFIWAYWKTIWSKPANPSKFSLPRAEKELYEREERAEAQQEILKKVARNLPVYTRTTGGGMQRENEYVTNALSHNFMLLCPNCFCLCSINNPS